MMQQVAGMATGKKFLYQCMFFGHHHNPIEPGPFGKLIYAF
ncbi:MAG: hypothetical protein RL172_1489, partial [Bacteroidota bacterium]